MPKFRLCHIVDGSVEDSVGAGDGAYDLFDLIGTPKEIGQAIAESLATTDLLFGRDFRGLLETGQSVFLCLRIEISQAVEDEQSAASI